MRAVIGRQSCQRLNVFSHKPSAECILWCYGRVKTRWEASRQARSLVTGGDLARLPLALNQAKVSNGAAVRPLPGAEGNATARPLSSVASSMNSLGLSTAQQRRGKKKRRGTCQVLFCFRLDLTSRAECAVESAAEQCFTALHFRFCLPGNLPSSFELPASCLADGSVASVAYSLRLALRCSNPTLVHIVRHPFRVLRSLDLAEFPTLTDRVTLHREFRPTLGSFLRHPQCLLSSDPILCDLSVNKTGFVPGESLMVYVTVKNGSSQPIRMVHLSLFQRVKMVGRKKSQSSVEFIRLFAAVLKNLTVPSNQSPCQRVSMTQTDDSAVPEATSGYFMETIHVPPLPAISPCYASFDFSTGSIREPNPRDSDCPVYLYFRATAVDRPTFTISPNTPLRTVLDQESNLVEGPRRSLSIAPQEKPPPLPARRPPARVAKGLSWEPSVEPHRTSSSRSSTGRPAVTRYNSETHLRSPATPQLRDKLYFDDGELLAQTSSSHSVPSSSAHSASPSSSEYCSYELSSPSPPCSAAPDRPKLAVRLHSAHVQYSVTNSSEEEGSEVGIRVSPPDVNTRQFRQSAGNPFRHSFRRQNSHCSPEST
ncbi:unnamed protein product [Schistocephalus solidus]|uniref:Arrestin_C domain-containing protein n=1 Tax=Schistocephalus solidus TaxID=70667 RepID=A0A183SLF7_SCHSO|nr:unnamed protein product [Schistocephalus solidus]